MLTLDLILAAILAIFVFSGLTKGLIRSLGRIFGLIIGAYIASNFYLLLFEWGQSWVGGREALGKVLSFIILFVVATRLVYFIFYLIEKIFKLIAIIPGSKYINNILGGLFGLIEGSLFLGLIFFVALRYEVISNIFGKNLEESIIIPWLLKVVDLVLPILPEALQLLKTLI